jgi:potassium large conductance calcium-activated channel subfamily M alpha protein 1
MDLFFFNRVGQISLYEGPLASFGEGGKYIDLFVTALRNYGMLCIGLYRYLGGLAHCKKKVSDFPVPQPGCH